MNFVNQATNYLTSHNKYDILFTVNITCMMVLASIYLSVSTSLPVTADIKPIEVWLIFSMAFPFIIILVNVVLQVNVKFEVINSISWDLQGLVKKQVIEDKQTGEDERRNINKKWKINKKNSVVCCCNFVQKGNFLDHLFLGLWFLALKYRVCHIWQRRQISWFTFSTKYGKDLISLHVNNFLIGSDNP